MKLSLTLRGAAAGSAETHAGVLGKFTPSGLLLCFPVGKYDFSILDTSVRAGALSLKSLDAVVPCITMAWPMGLVTSNAGFVFAAETEKELPEPKPENKKADFSQWGGDNRKYMVWKGQKRRSKSPTPSCCLFWIMISLLSPASPACSCVTLNSQSFRSPLAF